MSTPHADLKWSYDGMSWYASVESFSPNEDFDPDCKFCIDVSSDGQFSAKLNLIGAGYLPISDHQYSSLQACKDSCQKLATLVSFLATRYEIRNPSKSHARTLVMNIAAICKKHGGEVRVKEHIMFGLSSSVGVTFGRDVMSGEHVFKLVEPKEEG